MRVVEHESLRDDVRVGVEHRTICDERNRIALPETDLVARVPPAVIPGKVGHRYAVQAAFRRCLLGQLPCRRHVRDRLAVPAPSPFGDQAANESLARPGGQLNRDIRRKSPDLSFRLSYARKTVGLAGPQLPGASLPCNKIGYSASGLAGTTARAVRFLNAMQQANHSEHVTPPYAATRAQRDNCDR